MRYVCYLFSIQNVHKGEKVFCVEDFPIFDCMFAMAERVAEPTEIVPALFKDELSEMTTSVIGVPIAEILF